MNEFTHLGTISLVRPAIMFFSWSLHSTVRLLQ